MYKNFCTVIIFKAKKLNFPKSFRSSSRSNSSLIILEPCNKDRQHLQPRWQLKLLLRRARIGANSPNIQHLPERVRWNWWFGNPWRHRTAASDAPSGLQRARNCGTAQEPFLVGSWRVRTRLSRGRTSPNLLLSFYARVLLSSGRCLSSLHPERDQHCLESLSVCFGWWSRTRNPYGQPDDSWTQYTGNVLDVFRNVCINNQKFLASSAKSNFFILGTIFVERLVSKFISC